MSESEGIDSLCFGGIDVNAQAGCRGVPFDVPSSQQTSRQDAQVLFLRKFGPAGSVYIGRGSKWGNPFRIGVDGDRATVIARHEAWLRTQRDLLGALDELRGKDLVCFCAPQPCHGDLLLRLANATREQRIAWWRDHR
jgi:hypothetical protein